MASRKQRTRRSFGALRKLPSGRWQASYLDPHGKRVNAPETFTAKIDADAWLSVQRAALETGTWRGKPDDTTVGEYVESWKTTLNVSHRTRYNYEASIRRWILPTFGATPLHQVTPAAVRRWVATFPESKPAARAQAYTVLGRVFRDAVAEGKIPDSPVRVRGAADYRTAREGHALTVPEVTALAAKMPDTERLAVMLAAMCALRPGEVLALRRRDVDRSAQVVKVRGTASAKIGGSTPIGPTKTASSVRDVHYPAELDGMIRDHITEHAAPGAAGLLFPMPSDPARPVAYSTWGGHFRSAAKAAGLEDVKPHDLRHTGATLAADTGATVRELMARLGHTSPTVAIRYQHAAKVRDKSIADALGAAITAAGKTDEETTTDE
ncbi:MAG: tyrosine-type recombinase/integrase [Brachybacterium sp.]